MLKPNDQLLIFFFTGTTTLCGSWPPPWFFRGLDRWPHAQPQTWRTRGSTSSGPYPLTYLTWAALPRGYAPASITVWVIRARKSPFHNKAVVLEEALTNYFQLQHDIEVTNVPPKLRACAAAQRLSHARTRVSVSRAVFFVMLV
jgi:hypothetical protein